MTEQGEGIRVNADGSAYNQSELADDPRTKDPLRALQAIAAGNAAQLVLAHDGFKDDEEFAAALLTQIESDKNWLRAQRDVAEEKTGQLERELSKARALVKVHESWTATENENEELARKLAEIAEKLRRASKPLDDVDRSVIRKHLWELYD